MKFDKPNAVNSVEKDIRIANARIAYEDPGAYAAWRLRMGLQPPAAPVKGAPPDPHGEAVRAHMARLEPEAKNNPVMRARIAAEFRKIGVGLSAIPDEKKFKPSLRPYALPDKAVPIGASDALRAHNTRRAEAEKSRPF